MKVNVVCRVVSLLALMAPAALVACSSTPEAGQQAQAPSPAQQTNPRRGRGARSVGAVDQDYRREGQQATGSIFAPLDLPAPNDQRLGSGAPGPGYWQQRVDYTIDARLDTERRAVGGRVEVVYHNNSPHRLDYVWLQLEQNLFRLDSIGTRQRTPDSVMEMLKDDFPGGYTVTGLESGGAPMDLHVYDTLGRFEPPAPIEPGAEFRFSYSFDFLIPPHLRRMGAEDMEQGTIYEVAQWFPSVCNYDDVHGWNTLDYLGTGEFYTNYGSFRVDITVPAGQIVSATGVLQNPEEALTATQRERLSQAIASDEPVRIVAPDEVGSESVRPRADGEVTWRFAADDVRTFAWASSDAFIWDAVGASVKDRQGNTKRVLVQSFYPKEARAWDMDDEDGGATRAGKHSIEFYSGFVWPYPYPVMSNINGPEGGMEYPMIVFCGSRGSPDDMVGVTDHEIGHTWFPMIVNSDERRYMWQDEGFNTFINIYSIADFKGEEPSIERHLGQARDIASSVHPQPIMTAPDRMWPRWVGGLNYRKTGLGLFLLREKILGHERFDYAFHEYVRRWVFKHPQPADFFRTMEDAAGVDLDWFWRGWFFEAAGLDQAVVEVFNNDDHAVVVLDNLGRMVMPVFLRVTYEDGATEDIDLPVEIWSATDRWRARLNTGGRKIVKVEIDPDEYLPDQDRGNNVWSE